MNKNKINGWILIFFILILLAATLPCHATGGYGGREGNSSLRFSPDSKYLALAYGNRTCPIKLLDLETGRIIKIFSVEKEVSDLSFSPNGEFLVASIMLYTEPSEGVLRVWDVQTGKEIAYTKTPAVFFLRFLEDNKTIAYEFFGDIKEWNIVDGTTKESRLEPMDLTHSSVPRGRSIAASMNKGVYVTAFRQEVSPVIVRDTVTN